MSQTPHFPPALLTQSNALKLEYFENYTIAHPRLEEGFRRARLYEPKRIIVLPYFMFTGVLMEKIGAISPRQLFSTL